MKFADSFIVLWQLIFLIAAFCKMYSFLRPPRKIDANYIRYYTKKKKKIYPAVWP